MFSGVILWYFWVEGCATSSTLQHVMDTGRALHWPFFRSEVGCGTDQAYSVDLLIEFIHGLNRNLSFHLSTILLAYAWEAALPSDCSGSVHFYYKDITVRGVFTNVRSMRSFLSRTFAPYVIRSQEALQLTMLGTCNTLLRTSKFESRPSSVWAENKCTLW